MKRIGKSLLLALTLALCVFSFAACAKPTPPTSYDGTWLRTAEDEYSVVTYYHYIISSDTMTVYVSDTPDGERTAIADNVYRLTERTEERVTAVNTATGKPYVFTVTTSDSHPALQLSDPAYLLVKQQ